MVIRALSSSPKAFGNEMSAEFRAVTHMSGTGFSEAANLLILVTVTLKFSFKKEYSRTHFRFWKLLLNGKLCLC